MTDPKFIDDLARRISDSIPTGAKELQQDIEKNVHTLLQGAFAGTPIVVTRDIGPVFDVEAQFSSGRARDVSVTAVADALQVEFADSDSMMEGRSLSMFAEFELVARVAVSGQRNQQPGDWYGSVIVRPEESKSVQLVISELVP